MVSNGELELVGAIIGDGHIHKKHPKYYLGITGNTKTDYLYFAKLASLIEQEWNKKASVFESSGGLRIRIYSKALVEKLTTEFALPFNNGKCYSVSIPQKFVGNFGKAKHILRGIADTDGSVFVSRKPGCPRYPAIEITTVSKALAVQIRDILFRASFRVTKIRSHMSKLSTTPCYKVCLYGKKNLHKWIAEIGFSNPYKLGRAVQALE